MSSVTMLKHNIINKWSSVIFNKSYLKRPKMSAQVAQQKFLEIMCNVIYPHTKVMCKELDRESVFFLFFSRFDSRAMKDTM